MDINAYIHIDAPVHLGLLPGVNSVSVFNAQLLSFLDVPETVFSTSKIIKEEDMHFNYEYDVFGKAQYLDNGACLYKWSDGNISYSDGLGDMISQLWNYYKTEIASLTSDGLPNPEDVQQALRKAMDIAETAKIPVSQDAYECTYLSAKNIREYAERFDKEVVEGSIKKMDAYSTRVDENSSCYIFTFPLVYNGLQMEDFFYITSANGQHVTMKKLEVIVVSDDLVYLSAPYTYEVTGVFQDVSMVLSLEEAIEALAAKFEQVLNTQHAVIYEITFAYGVQVVSAGTNGFRIIPCWIFKEIPKEAFDGSALLLESYKSNTYYHILNATNGEWVE